MGRPDPQQETSFPPLVVLAFYTVALGLAFGLSWVFLDRLDIWHWHDRFALPPWLGGLLGVGCGAITVAFSQWLDRVAEWARELTEAFQEILGQLRMLDVWLIAFSSSIAEELLFRGFLQAALTEAFGGLESTAAIIGALLVSNIIFAGLHVGPDRRYLPWTGMALIMGIVFGLLFYVTGNVTAPILAHFTINFFNLLLMQKDDEETSS